MCRGRTLATANSCASGAVKGVQNKTAQIAKQSAVVYTAAQKTKIAAIDKAAKTKDFPKVLELYRQSQPDTAKVKHGALATGQKCANCHNPKSPSRASSTAMIDQTAMAMRARLPVGL